MSVTNSVSEEERTNNEALRTAAETIVNFLARNPNLNSSVSSLTNNPIYVRDYRDVPRPRRCKRFFCLFLAFDLILTGLFWIFTVIVSGEKVESALKDLILHYHIKRSMFDLVVFAAFRFSIGIILYGICQTNHRWPMFVITAGSSAFLMAKVILFDWSKQGSIMFNVGLVFISFMLTWGELWYLDIKVVPEALEEKQYCGIHVDERTPLISGPSTGRVHSFLESQQCQSSVANFFSPMESPNESEDELEPDTGVFIPKKLKRIAPLSNTELDYIKMGEETLKKAWGVLNSSDWKLDKELDNGDTVHFKEVKRKKIFKLTGRVNLPPKLLLEELYFKIENVPIWNPSLSECRLVQHVDGHTDVNYQVCAEAAGGVIAVRDFVTLRRWGLLEGGVYASTGVSIKHPAMPQQTKKVRGENGPGGWFMHPLPDNPDSCKFQWLLDTDLKGWIPSGIIDSAMSKVQLDYISYLRKYAETLYESGFVANWKKKQLCRNDV